MRVKQIKIIKPLKISFVNDASETTAQIINPPANFIVPRIGEEFQLSKDGRTNIVESVYHDYSKNEILIFYDFFMCFENKTLEEVDIDSDRIPEEEFKKKIIKPKTKK